MRNFPFSPLEPGAYGLILADPPWSFLTRSDKGKGKSPDRHYGCMSLDDIKALPVRDLAAKDCALVMWATAPMLPRAIGLMADWGFIFKTSGAWAKQSKTGASWAFGTGYLLRSAAEFWIVGTIGKPAIGSRSVRNLIVAPTREHSRKPDDLHKSLEQLFPCERRCELFARQQREGWEVFGNESDKFSGEAA